MNNICALSLSHTLATFFCGYICLIDLLFFFYLVNFLVLRNIFLVATYFLLFNAHSNEPDFMTSVKKELDCKFLDGQMEMKEIKNEVKIEVDEKQEFVEDVKGIVGMSTENKVKEQNRIRQLTFKAREKMPKDYKLFCLVAAHLVKNAHRYYSDNSTDGSAVAVMKSETRVIKTDLASLECNDLNSDSKCKIVNKKLREIRNLK